MSRVALIRVCIAAASIAVFVAVGMAWWFIFRNTSPQSWRYWQQRLPQSIAEARAQGILTTVEEANEPTPAGVNGAPLIDSAHATLEFSKLDPAPYSWVPNYAKGGKKRSDVVREVKRFSPQIPAILAASQADFYRWDVDPSQFYNAVFAASRVSQALTESAVVVAMEGDPRNLKAAFRANQNVRRGLRNLGTGNSLHQANVLREKAARSLEQLSTNANVAPEQVRELVLTLDDPPVSIKHAIRFEAISEMNGYESGRGSDWMQDDTEFKEIVDPSYYLEWKSYARAPESALREAYSARLLSRLVQQWKDAERSILEMAKSAQGRKFPSYGYPKRPTPMDWMDYFSLDMGLIATEWIQRDVETDLYLAAVEVHLYKRQYGKWPEGLSQVPRAPKDRWTGLPLHYRKQADQFSVWSAGPDGKNDFGKLDDQIFETRVPPNLDPPTKLAVPGLSRGY